MLQEVLQQEKAKECKFVQKSRHRLTFITNYSFLQNRDNDDQYFIYDLSYAGADLAHLLGQAALLVSQEPDTYGCKPFAGTMYTEVGFLHLSLQPYLEYTENDDKETKRFHFHVPRTRPLFLTEEENIYKEEPASTNTKWAPFFLIAERGTPSDEPIENVLAHLFELKYPGKARLLTCPIHVTDNVSMEMLKLYYE
jgi:hypothetical protein